MKLQISLDEELVKRLDSYAEKNYMTRSGLISFSVSQYLNQAEVMLAVTDMSLAFKKIAEKGTIDQDTLEQLEDFDRLCRMMMGTK